MVKISSAKVIESGSGRVVSEFDLVGGPPERGDTVWVPDNGDVAYFVLGRRFDYTDGVVVLNCRPNPNLEKDT